MNYNKWLATSGQLMDEASQKHGTAHPFHVTPIGYRCLRGMIAAVALAAISACSSNYLIKATDGTVYQTQGAPVLENGAYKFLDAHGVQQQVYLSKVAQVVKR